MKTYPTISKQIVHQQIYAFDKLDGSNIRAEWDRKKGFHKFGTRKQLLGSGDELLGEAIELIVNKYQDDLAKIFKEQRYNNKVICFFEFHGPNSFAGSHADEKHDVTLFDVAPHKKGILEPKDFIKIFDSVDKAELLYMGNPNEDFAQQVREGTFENMTFEGVVCKGKYFSPGRPLMFKIKNKKWIDKLKKKCGDNEKLFEQLL